MASRLAWAAWPLGREISGISAPARKGSCLPVNGRVIAWRNVGEKSNVLTGAWEWLVASGRETQRREPLTVPYGKHGRALIFLVLGNAIDGFLEVLARLVAETVLHEESVFAAIFVERPQDADGPEILFAEE